MVMTEQVWLEKLEKGEEEAFRVLFETFYARLGSFACRFVDEQVVAEDIVQDILYDLWMKKLHFENLWALKSYLYNMVRNRCLDILKHRKVEEKYLQEQRNHENSESFLLQLLEDEVYILLKEAIQTLPSQTAKVFELILDGLDNTEISAKLNLSLDAVKSHKKRGKKLLQEKLKRMILFICSLRVASSVVKRV